MLPIYRLLVVPPKALVIDIGLRDVRCGQLEHWPNVGVNDLRGRPQGSLLHYWTRHDLLAFELFVDIFGENAKIGIWLAGGLVERTLADEVKAIRRPVDRSYVDMPGLARGNQLAELGEGLRYRVPPTVSECRKIASIAWEPTTSMAS